MGRLKRWVIILLVALVGLVGRPTVVYGAAEFETRYDISYQVLADGKTNVIIRISLKNILSNVYADRFSLSVGFTDVTNIRVRDQAGLIEPEVRKTENQTTISFNFIDKVVGKDKINNFSIAYQTRDVAIKNGSIWEVNIPRLETDKPVDDQKVTLIVPSSFGQPAYIDPKPSSAANNIYVFEAVTLGKKAISAVFGTTQYMRFKLTYQLENKAPVKLTERVALPPDTNYQTVLYESIEPEPDRVEVDEDGNFLASFGLKPGAETEVVVRGVLKLNFEPGPSRLEPVDRSFYLAETPFWQVNHPQIESLAISLKTPKAIYDYVTDYLSYDYTKLEVGNQRIGALSALTTPLKAICTEFTDLFVALARAAGIPARELQGFAFTSNDKLRPLSLTRDVLHAWPEYYDETRGKWIQVDPTWGKTTGGIDYFNKLDLNHFVFVVHGRDSVLPLPAGAYKKLGSNQKGVEVEVATPVKWPAARLEFEAEAGGWLKRELKLRIMNTGQVAESPLIAWKTDPAGIIMGRKQLAVIPAYGDTELVLALAPIWSLKPGLKNIIVSYGKEQFIIPVSKARTLGLNLAWAVGSGIGVILVAAAIITGRLWLLRRKKKTALYR